MSDGALEGENDVDEETGKDGFCDNDDGADNGDGNDEVVEKTSSMMDEVDENIEVGAEEFEDVAVEAVDRVVRGAGGDGERENGFVKLDGVGVNGLDVMAVVVKD